MATSELAFQSELVKAINAAGGHAFKTSNRFLAGVPDIHFSWNKSKVKSAYIECKFQRFNRPFHGDAEAVRLKITPLQQDFIDKETKAGGHGACAACVVWEDCYWVGFFDPLSGTTTIRKHETVRKGKPWDRAANFLNWL